MDNFVLLSELITEPTAKIWADFEAALEAAKNVLTANPAAFAAETVDSEGIPYDNPPELDDILAAMGDVPCEAGAVKVQTRILSAFVRGEDAWIAGHGNDTYHIYHRIHTPPARRGERKMS